MNKQLWKRGVGLLAALALLTGLLPVGALAAPSAAAAETRAGSVVGTAYADDSNIYEIYPVPHSLTYPGGEFTLTQEVNVVVDDEVDSYTTDFVREILTRFGHTVTTSDTEVIGKSNIVLAINPAMNEEGHYDPYTLEAQDGTITITGRNTDCVYYGVATLQMMFTSFNGERFPNVRIEDYSDTIFRGFVEGFYGPGFRSYADRESQMRAIRDVKGNMYVFAAKGDEYHGGSHWADEYPADELAQIKHLVDVGKETKVHYTWSLHIGKSHALDNVTLGSELYTQRLDQVKAKFQQLYDVGVRSFNILNDDFNSGTYDVQVQLLNDINAWLKEEKGDCMPLIYCCAGYNTAWALQSYGGGGTELPALQALDDDIYLYWTGSDVNTPITQENVDWPHTQSGQPIVGWLNYPCSEHSGGRGIFLGNIYHYVKDADGLTGHYGLLSNGMASPEANKVAYFQLMSWAWNREHYTDYLEELWEDSFKYLQPEVYDAYLTIARNVSNCPNSGRIPEGFPESEYIKDALETVEEALLNGDALADIADAQGLMDELDHILTAINDFRANCENDALKAELEPWLKSLADVATAAKKGMEAADALAKEDVSGAWNAFSQGAVALGKWNSYPSSNPDVSNNVKAGSLRLQPFAQAVLDYVEDAMAQQFTPGGLTGGGRVPLIRTAGVEQANDANAQKMFDGDLTTYASYGANQHVDDYIGLDLGGVKVVTAVDILQGQNDTHHDYFHKAAVEYSVDGESWTTLVTKVNSHHIVVDGLNIAARYVRMRLLEVGYQGPNFEHNGGANYYTYVREFTVTEKAEPFYTNADHVEAEQESAGGAHTLTVANAALASGEYVGIRLPELTGIRTVTTTGTLPGGVVVEWSVNGETWSQTLPAQTTLMGYVRLRATAAATLENITLTAGEPIQTNLTYVSSGPQIGLYSGSWSDLVDGDRATQLYTNGAQTTGQYIIVDLGARQPVRDITLYFAETSDCPHHLSISLGDTTDPDGTWATIASFADGDKVISPPYGTFTCNANGQTGRYLKLQVTADSNQWMKLNELEVNTTVPREEPLAAETATSGNAADAVDGDLLTFFAPDVGAAGSWTKLLQAPTALTGVTVLRGADGSTAKVEVQQNNTWKQVGTLTQSAATVSLAKVGAVTGVRISWTGSDVPAIAEVILSGEALPAGETPELRPNIYEKPADPAGVAVANGTALEDLPLPDKVAVTLSGGDEVSVPVVWSGESYDPATAGAYTFTGTFPQTFNPGGFAVTTTVTVRAAESGTPTAENLALNGTVYASGREVASQGPECAVDGAANTHWSGNKMKQKDNSGKFDTIEDAVSWITVDLGTDVSTITQIAMTYNAKVWPLAYYVQAGGSDISYEGYTTPSIDTDNATTDTGDVTFAAGYAGTMHALDAPGWTTVYAGTREAGDATNPTITLGEGGDAAFTAEIPAGTRYLRLYFTQINPNALAGTGIGLKELTVTGTRAPASPNVVSVTPVTAEGVTGTAWSELELPTRVNVSMSDGTAARLAVTWDDTGYDPTLTTPQTFTGTLVLTGNQTNTDNVTATLTVTLTAPPEPPDDPDPVTPATPSNPSGNTPSAPVESTKTETREDGAKVTTVTKPDGSKVVTVEQPDGAKAETVMSVGRLTLTVTDPDGEELVKTEIPVMPPYPTPEFEDITQTPWAEEAINKVAALKLVNGIGDNKYDPTTPMTRGSLATVLHRLSNGKTDYEVAFKDVAANRYYTEGVAWAAKAKVVNGYTTEIFAPDDVITREQLAVMMARYAKLIGMDTTAKAESLDSFTDGDTTGAWAVDGVAWAVEHGILKGKGNDTLDPTANVSRAEVAVMLDRFIAQIMQTAKESGWLMWSVWSPNGGWQAIS